MLKNNLEKTALAFILTLLLMPISPIFASPVAGTIDSSDKYAWSENLGWIDFGTTEGNVEVTDAGLTGYAWGENIGWISLNCSNTSSCGTVDYSVSNDGLGTLSGYAWSENVGWINFNPSNGGVTIDREGNFLGYAWGENVGWVVFNCATTDSCATVDYKVKTDYRPQNYRSSVVDLTPPAAVGNASISTDGVSVTLNWTDPADSDLQRIEILRNNGGSSPITNTIYAFVDLGVGTYKDSSVEAGNSYKYIVRSVDRGSNYSNSDEISITVEIPAGQPVAEETGAAETGEAAPAEAIKTKEPAVPPTGEEPMAPPAEKLEIEPIAKPSDQITKIVGEAAMVALGQVSDVLEEVEAQRSLDKELNAVKVVKKLLGGERPSKSVVQFALTNFVAYGTKTTTILGSGERAGVLNSFKAAFSKMPETSADWEDAIKIANGRWPSQRSEVAENSAKETFKTIYLREADMSNAHDNAAVTVMAYGLRPADRNLNSERAAIKIFRDIFKKYPVSARDWDAVRAIAYSGAAR